MQTTPASAVGRTMHRAILFAALFFVRFAWSDDMPSTVSVVSSPLQLPDCRLENEAPGWKIPARLWSIGEDAGRNGSPALIWENDSPDAYSFPQCSFPVTPGSIFRYGAWVKVDSLNGKSNTAKPRVTIDYADKAGNWIGADYALVVGQPDADGWVRYEGVTAPVLPIAVRANLFGFVSKGGTGRVRFCGFTIERIEELRIDALVSNAYRDEASEGKVTFTATLFPVADMPPEALSPAFVFTNASGRQTEVAPDTFDAVHASLSLDVDRLAQGTQNVVFALRTREGHELGRAALPFTRGFRQRRVAFDRFGRTLVDGRPFFPLGMYARDVTTGTLALYTNGAPWNCIMPYHAPAAGMLDLCDQAGLKVVYCVKDIVFGAQFAKPPYSTSREASLAEISKRATEAKGHPAILAYYTNDEAPPRQAGVLREVRNLLHRIDPDHPVWHVIDKAYKIRPMLGAFDVLGTDPYPVGLEERLPEHAAIGEVTRSIRAARAEMLGVAPIWQVVQAFDWTWDKRWNYPSQRFPSREEISCMTWQAIANGANGVIYYAFHRLCMGAPPEKRDEYLQRVAAVGHEVRSQMETLLCEPGPPVVSAPDGMVCRTWRKLGGGTVLLAANTTRDEVSGRAILAGGTVTSITLPPLGHLFTTVTDQQDEGE